MVTLQRRWVHAAVWTLAAASSSLALEAQTPTSAPVDAFYPVDRLKPANDSDRQSCSAALSQAPGSEPTHVVAGYTDRTNGAIRLLRRSSTNGYEVVFDQPDTWTLPGSRCSVRLRDVDLDGRPEVFVYFFGTRASTGWIFKWDGVALTNLTPTTQANGRVSSMLLDPQLYDLDHTGPLEVVATRDIERLGPTQRSRTPAFIYRLGATGFEVAGSLLAIAAYRGDVDPRSNLRAFRLAEDSTSPFTLRIVNGDREGRHRALGVTVTLNEVAVVESRDVTSSMPFATTRLSALSVQNHLTATLDGPPDATVLVLIEDGTARK